MNAFQSWKEQFDHCTAAVKNIEINRSFFREIEAYEHGKVPADYNATFDGVIQRELQQVQDKENLLTPEELQEAALYRLSKQAGQSDARQALIAKMKEDSKSMPVCTEEQYRHYFGDVQ